MATAPLDEAALHAEIRRHCRRRMAGVWLALVVAALLLIPLPFTMRMMHGADDYTVVAATIVELGRNDKGELLMTSEFTDASGVVHRETETEGYHYAPGAPKVGQRIEYLYRTNPWSKSFDAFPRADRMLQWVFGAPAAFLAVFGIGLAWLVLRQRSLRRRLVRSGRREVGQAPTIRHRTVVLPAGRGTHAIPMWRLEARYFEPTQSAFVECHSDWQHEGEPTLAEGSTATILVDPQQPSRYWLPVATPGG